MARCRELRPDLLSYGCCREPAHDGGHCAHFSAYLDPKGKARTLLLATGVRITCHRQEDALTSAMRLADD